MDLWDVVKLIARRWVVSVPLLLITLAAVVWTGITVKPNYTAEGNVLLLPPSTEVSTGEGEERAVNPWTTDSLTGAVITLLRNRNTVEMLAAEGYVGSWEAERDIQFWSVVNIQVTAPTAAQAQATIQRLAQVVNNEVVTRQEGYGLTEGQKVGTVTLGAGENVAIARGNQIRALIVVFFAGAIITVGSTIGFDAWMRKRAGERIGHSRITATVSPAIVNASVEVQPLVASGAARAPNGAKSGRFDDAKTEVFGRQAGITVSYRGAPGVHAPTSAPPAAPTSPAPSAPPVRTDSDDATIVLPLAGLDLPRIRAAEHDQPERHDHADEDSDSEGPSESKWV
jgi:capsular polysaccharide biosynthesis protein